MKSRTSQTQAFSNESRTWPSWLPDWNDPLSLFPLKKKLFIAKKFGLAIRLYDRRGTPDFKEKITNVYNATTDSRPRFRIDGLQLKIDGIYLDVITELLPITDAVNTRDQAMALWAPNHSKPYSSGESDETFAAALVHTLVADVQFDFYRRTCSRNSYLDFNLLSKSRNVLGQEQYQLQTNMKAAYDESTFARSLCRTSKGYLGFVPEAAVIGDHIYALLGSQVLYALRKGGGDGQKCEFVGEAYVHGMMDGKAMSGGKVKTVILI
jgi:hypothetical protein